MVVKHADSPVSSKIKRKCLFNITCSATRLYEIVVGLVKHKFELESEVGQIKISTLKTRQATVHYAFILYEF